MAGQVNDSAATASWWQDLLGGATAIFGKAVDFFDAEDQRDAQVAALRYQSNYLAGDSNPVAGGSYRVWSPPPAGGGLAGFSPIMLVLIAGGAFLAYRALK